VSFVTIFIQPQRKHSGVIKDIDRTPIFHRIMKLFPSFSGAIIVLLVAMMLPGCAFLSPPNPCLIHNHLASETLVIVPKRFEFGNYGLPAGTYVPVCADTPSWYYFAAPDKVTANYLFFRRSYTGGLLLPIDGTKAQGIKMMWHSGDGVSRKTIPSDFRYSLIHLERR